MDSELLYALTDKYTIKIEYDSSNNPVYIGEAAPGTETTEATWRIKKITYSGSDIIAVEWASATTEFNKIWDDRAEYEYS